MRLRRLLILLTGVLGCAGCTPRQEVPDAPPPVAWDEVLTLPEIVTAVNANSGALETLWARGIMDGVVYETRNGKSRSFASLDVTLLHQKPDQFRMKVKKVGLREDVLDLGTDGDQLWLLMPVENTLYLGNTGRLDPDALDGLPIRPDLILQVLGVNLLAADLLDQPFPTQRYNPDLDVYMLEFHELALRGEPRMVTVKEVWLDREELLPRKVVLYDERGRVVLRADLGRFVEVPQRDEALPPAKVATSFRLYFPETFSTLRIELDELKRKNRGVPRAGSFRPRFESYDLDQTFDLNRRLVGRLDERGAGIAGPGEADVEN